MDIDVALPVLFGDRQKMLRLSDPGIIHQHIQPPECRRGLAYGRLRLRAVTHVDGFDEGTPAERFDLLARRVCPFRIQVQYRYVCPLSRKAQGNSFADAAARPGNECHLSLELHETSS